MQIGEKYDICRENFHGLVAFAAPKDSTPQNLWRKLSQIATFAKVFSLESFPLNGMYMYIHQNYFLKLGKLHIYVHVLYIHSHHLQVETSYTVYSTNMLTTHLHCLVGARVEIPANDNKGPYPVVLGW